MMMTLQTTIEIPHFHPNGYERRPVETFVQWVNPHYCNEEEEEGFLEK